MQRLRTKTNAGRIESKDANTGEVTITYIGTLEENRQRRIEDLKEWCGTAILKAYPDYKQTNAALGVYDTQKTAEIKDGIQAYRAYCDAKEADINAATTEDEVWAVHIDFSEVEP